MTAPGGGPRTAARWLPWFVLGNALFWALLWASQAMKGATRDWRHFHDMARLVLAGRANEIYPGYTPGLPFIHPPYAVWPFVPLGLLSEGGSYLVCTLSTVLAMAGALLLLRRALPGQRRQFATGALLALGSPSWTTMMALGQVSSWYLLVVCAGLSLWMRGRRGWAGAILSLLMFKPNIGAVFPLLFLARRQGRLLGGWLAGMLLLLASTLPLGPGVWRNYVRSVRTMSGIIERIPVWKQHTLVAFWHSFVHRPALLAALWATSALPLAAATGWAWLRADLDASNLPRLFGVTVLMIVTCSPYLHHYDALLLTLPGLVWYLDRGSYRSATLRAVGGAALLAAYLIQEVSLWLIEGGWSLVGPAVAVWLVAELLDLARARAERPAQVESD
ncbi:MAG TPA: glycosyltransferase family 87 protein [Polyangia bacterium]